MTMPRSRTSTRRTPPLELRLDAVEHVLAAVDLRPRGRRPGRRRRRRRRRPRGGRTAATSRVWVMRVAAAAAGEREHDAARPGRSASWVASERDLGDDASSRGRAGSRGRGARRAPRRGRAARAARCRRSGSAPPAPSSRTISRTRPCSTARLTLADVAPRVLGDVGQRLGGDEVARRTRPAAAAAAPARRRPWSGPARAPPAPRAPGRGRARSAGRGGCRSPARAAP